MLILLGELFNYNVTSQTITNIASIHGIKVIE